jgi:ferredoxin-type protein NapH
MGRFITPIRRWPVQLLGLILFNSYYFSGLRHIPCLSLNCQFCKLSVFDCPVRYFQRTFVARPDYWYVFASLGAAGLLVGTMACGWLCPFGYLQDLLYQIKVPKLKLSNRFGWTKYAVLVILVGSLSFFTCDLWFCKLCPVGTLEGYLPTAVVNAAGLPLKNIFTVLFILDLVILAAVLASMVFVQRAFCRLACPLGAFYSIFNPISLIQLKVDQTKCLKCDSCETACPAEIKRAQRERSLHCLRCFECVKSCPQSAIQISTIFSGGLKKQSEEAYAKKQTE